MLYIDSPILVTSEPVEGDALVLGMWQDVDTLIESIGITEGGVDYFTGKDTGEVLGEDDLMIWELARIEQFIDEALVLLSRPAVLR